MAASIRQSINCWGRYADPRTRRHITGGTIARDAIWKRLIGPSLMTSRMFIPAPLLISRYAVKTKQGRL